jgi:hypothetical protein
MPQDNFKGIRELGATQIANVVTKQYKLVQHQEVYERVANALVNLGITDYKMAVSFNPKGTRMFASIVFPKLDIEPQKGDICKYALTMTNSVDSSSSFALIPTTYRLWCSNGASHSESMGKIQKKHMGDLNYSMKRMESLITDCLRQQKLVSEKYKAWVDEPVVKANFVDYIKNEGKDLLPQKYVIAFEEANLRAGNKWELFNSLTALNTHDHNRSVGAKLEFNNVIEKLMEVSY